MNWDAIGAIGEIIGAIAVVATLAYLAQQIRYSSKIAAAQMVKGYPTLCRVIQYSVALVQWKMVSFK